MKKLILAGVLALGLSFPLTSQAEVNALGVSLPIERSEVSDNIHGGYVARDLMDTFAVQNPQNPEVTGTVDETEFENVYSVFGIRISGDRVI